MSHRWKRSQKPSRLTPEAWGSRKPQKLRENQIPKSSEKVLTTTQNTRPHSANRFFRHLIDGKKTWDTRHPWKGKTLRQTWPPRQKKTLSKCVCAGTLSPCQPSSNLSFSLSDCQPLKGVGKKKKKHGPIWHLRFQLHSSPKCLASHL